MGYLSLIDKEKSKLGTELMAHEQRIVLNSFVHRYTKEHKPAWANKVRDNGKPYRPQFSSDRDWLANTRFAVTSKGKLDHRVRHCHSTPTWPEGK